VASPRSFCRRTSAREPGTPGGGTQTIRVSLSVTAVAGVPAKVSVFPPGSAVAKPMPFKTTVPPPAPVPWSGAMLASMRLAVE
jgi:hypothetical protein